MPARVLIVDDHPAFRAAARRLLEVEGYDVVGEAADGREAVELARICVDLGQAAGRGTAALVTDMDAGAESGEGVGQEQVFALFGQNLERLSGLLTTAIAALPDPDGCVCGTWWDGVDLTYDVP